MGQALTLPTGEALTANDNMPETITIEGVTFTRSDIEDGDLVEKHGDRIAEKIASGIYFTRYYPENRVRSLDECSEIAKHYLTYPYGPEQRCAALDALSDCGDNLDWTVHEEVRPALEKFREGIEEAADDQDWSVNYDDDEFDDQIEDLVKDILCERDDSKATDILSSCDRVEVMFTLMPRAVSCSPSDYCISSNRPWADWSDLSIDQGMLETLARLGLTLGDYRRHSRNRNKAYEQGYRAARRRSIPLLSMDEFKSLVDDACAQYFSIGIYAQVPLAQLLEVDLQKPVILTSYSLCSWSSSGTFFDIHRKDSIVINPEDGVWETFGRSGPDNWCGLSGSYYHGQIQGA